MPRLLDGVEQAIQDGQRQSETLFALSNAIQILFSDKVVLVEGNTESVLLPDIYTKVNNRTLDQDQIGLVQISGSGNIPGALRVLSSMGIPAKAIVDLDFAFKEAPKHELVDQEISEFKEVLKTFNKMRERGEMELGNDGFPKKSCDKTASEHFKALAQTEGAKPHIETIHLSLLEKDIWCWKSGSIEVPLNLDGKKSGVHVAFLQKLNDQGFLDNLPGSTDIKKLMDWISD